MGLTTKIFGHCLASFCYLATLTTSAIAEGDGSHITPPTPAVAPQAATGEGERVKPDFISDGTRIELKDKEFAITPPSGWEVYTNRSNLSLLMQVPYEPNQKYQRTIQVAAFSGPRFIDETTAKEYEDIIVRKFSEASILVTDYRIRNHMTIDLVDGRLGLLFYSEFSIDGVDLMQAHILVSSAARHYLLTYTDLASHFEDDKANDFLTEAWNSMISVQLAGPSPTRFDAVSKVGVGAGALLVFCLTVWGVRRVLAGRKYQSYMRDSQTDVGALLTSDSRGPVTLEPMALDPVIKEASLTPETGFSRSDASSLDKRRQKKAIPKRWPSKGSSHDAGAEYNTGLGDDRPGSSKKDESGLQDDEDLAV